MKWGKQENQKSNDSRSKTKTVNNVHYTINFGRLLFCPGLLIGCGRKSEILWEFRGSFRGKLHQKVISKKRLILWLFSRQSSLEIDRFCADQTSIFNVFLTEVIIYSFNKNTPQKWTNGKAFNIMARAQFFTTQSTPGSFGVLFARFSDEVPG